MKTPVLLFVVIAGCCAKENLRGASFLFSKNSDMARVVLKPTVEEPLSNITICLQVYTDNVQRDSFIKLQTQNNSIPQFHLYQVGDYYHIDIAGDLVYYKTGKEKMEWRQICVSWDSSTGLIHFMVNGKLFPRRVLKRGSILNPDFTAVLGQNLATTGMEFLSNKPSYVGEIRDVNMWDHTLHPRHMQSLNYDHCCIGNVINWESADYEIHGDIFLYKP